MGTSCNDCSRRCAVTIISSSACAYDTLGLRERVDRIVADRTVASTVLTPLWLFMLLSHCVILLFVYVESLHLNTKNINQRIINIAAERVNANETPVWQQF